MAKSEDLNNYYKIPTDNRDLNYSKFYKEGVIHKKEIDEYNSHNTKRLNVEEMKDLLLKLPEIKKDFE